METHHRTEGGFGLTAMIIGLSTLALVILGAVALNSTADVSAPTLEETDTKMMSDDANDMEVEMMEEESTMMDDNMKDAAPMMDEKEEQMIDASEASAGSRASGSFTNYDPALLANANDGRVVLFFHANWCPSCRALERSINENLGAIPGDVTILKVDFDTENELRQKYGVVRQHTLVQVDANGTEIKTLTGLTSTLDQVVNQI